MSGENENVRTNEQEFPEDSLTFELHNVAASHGLAEEAAQEILRLRRVARAVDHLSEDEFVDHPDLAAAMDALHEPGWLLVAPPSVTGTE